MNYESSEIDAMHNVGLLHVVHLRTTCWESMLAWISEIARQELPTYKRSAGQYEGGSKYADLESCDSFVSLRTDCWDNSGTRYILAAYAVGPNSGNDAKAMSRIVEESGVNFEFAYGYACKREKRFGPLAYSDGIVQLAGFVQPQDFNRISTGYWHIGLSDLVYESGVIRDVYPVNYISHVHANVVVDGKRLLDWVERSAIRGKIRRIADGLIKWEVEEEYIDGVVSELSRAGSVLFSEEHTI